MMRFISLEANVKDYSSIADIQMLLFNYISDKNQALWFIVSDNFNIYH